MSKFFFEDTCSFKADPAIVGTVERTWSDTESSWEGLLDCYVHRDLPLKVRKAWFDHEKLTPGYVIIAFSQDYDGFCLVAESFLQLVERSLAAGDVVKKRLSDTMSGTVLNTSIMCSLQPLCSKTEFSRQQYPPIQGHTPSHGPHAPKSARKKATTPSPKLVHGFPAPTSAEPNSLKTAVPPLQAPASDLKFWNTYREEDTLIYKGWIGQVRSVHDEVTIRLANGSVVVVEDPEELEEPYWIPGTPSYELAQRLDRAGYYRYNTPSVSKPQSTPAEPCYPGQHVQTKKGNLRCGRWKFGAYDPAVTPRGIVAEVRNVQLEVRWLSPIAPQEGPQLRPSMLLEAENLETGEVIVYDRSKAPKEPVASALANASYSPDIGFGRRVRFKDPTSAAVKYGAATEGATHPNSTPIFDRIPRAVTQGFDMNVLQVVATSTRVTVRWQDYSITEEDSTQLFPYLIPDEHDVWPGEKVSFLPDEEKLGAEIPIIRLHKVGVVQSVDARERIARVRWFEGTEIDVDEAKASRYSASKYGKLRDEIAEIPLYDIAGHAALAMNRGDIVMIAPEHALSPAHVDSEENLGSFPPPPLDPDGDLGMPYAHSDSLPLSRVARTLPPFYPGLLTVPFERARMLLGLVGGGSSSTSQESSLPQGTECVGEVADLCLDGEVVVRLGAASKVREVKVPMERVLFISSANTDSSDYSDEEDDDDESYFSDAMSVSDEETDHETDQVSVGAIDVSVEYEGGEKLNDDDDEEMWATDEEDVRGLDTQESSNDDAQVDQRLDPTKDGVVQLDVGMALEPPTASSSADTPMSLSSHPSMPPRFSVFEAGAPSDHHFFGLNRPLTADLMRRVMKEHKIMQSSLPDGIFVRTWESRLDLLRVLIVGPSDTPYEFAPFVVDLHFGSGFPSSPPDAFFHSWTSGSGRINPNLYEDGKICLSLLGTWDANERNEEWSSKRSTMLQILVSLMGLVLVKEPYYSEYPTVNL